MDLTQTRYVAITLTEPEWEGLRALQPDPCSWLKSQVRQLLEEHGRGPSASEEEADAEAGERVNC